jgi:hypothetical protein
MRHLFLRFVLFFPTSVGIHTNPSICDAMRCPESSPELRNYIHAREKGVACTMVASSNKRDKGK